MHSHRPLIFYLGIQFPENCLKSELWAIVESHQPMKPRYHYDEMAFAEGEVCCVCVRRAFTGHEVVRLPVAHCELNPIEMAWKQLKDYVKE